MTIDAMHRIWAEQDGKWWIGSNCVHMGYCGEHDSYMLCFALEDLAYSGWAFKLDTSIGGGATLDMDTATQDSMLIISYEVDRSAVSLPGEFEACIRALGPGGEVKKSNVFMISVADTVLAGGELPPAPPSEWEQLERRINEAKNQAIQAADDAEAAEAEAQRIADDFVTEGAQAVDAAKAQADSAAASAIEAADYAADANASKIAAAQSADESASSATEGAGYAAEAKQAMQDYLAMLGVDVATLVGGKIPMSQIPATATQEIYDITSEDELTGLVAQRGDCAEIVETIDGVKTVTKTYQLLGDGDATVRDNWVVWGTSYAVQAGNATSATNAVNASTINNHRMVAMTQDQYDQAAVEQDTIYIVDPNEVV